jgi:hypothetical protein
MEKNNKLVFEEIIKGFDEERAKLNKYFSSFEKPGVKDFYIELKETLSELDDYEKASALLSIIKSKNAGFDLFDLESPNREDANHLLMIVGGRESFIKYTNRHALRDVLQRIAFDYALCIEKIKEKEKEKCRQ